MKLFLFDIDGTLIKSGNAGGKALELVFKQMFGVKKAMRGIRPDGKTDADIVEEILLKKTKQQADNSLIGIILDQYLSMLEETIKNPEYTVIEGVKEFLQRIHYDKVDVMGIATGNVELGAKIKLRQGDIEKYFKFGAYGSDSRDRKEILKIAVQRAVSYAGTDFEYVYIVGDTPLDVRAAREAGFISVAVATGNYSFSELLRENPDFLYHSLLDKDVYNLLSTGRIEEG